MLMSGEKKVDLMKKWSAHIMLNTFTCSIYTLNLEKLGDDGSSRSISLKSRVMCVQESERLHSGVHACVGPMPNLFLCIPLRFSRLQSVNTMCYIQFDY